MDLLVNLLIVFGVYTGLIGILIYSAFVNFTPVDPSEWDDEDMFDDIV